jgi:hypothetical protein
MKPNRNLWPLGIIVTFVLFFCGIATVIVIAATHPETLVSGNYYEQEMNFQNQIDGIARAQKSGAAIACDAANGLVMITVPAAQLAQKFSGTIELYRAAAPDLDREFRLEPRADGTQMLDVSRLAAGPWRVRAAWTAGGQCYFLEQKILIAPK